MKKKQAKGITLIALVITIIVLLILAGVAINTLMGDTGIINEGDGDSNSGQVKTEEDGYIYEIKEDKNGNWEVIYIGKGEIDKTAIIISVNGNTSGLANKVTLTIKANSGIGITKYTDTSGSVKTYSNGTTNIEETYEVTANGSYTFTVENSSGKTASKEVEISNILEGTIQISAKPSTPTKNNVTVTVVWPSNASNGIKEISTYGGATWQTVTGETSEIEVKSNCTVKARLIDSTNQEGTTATLSIINIDKTNPTVTATAGTETITEGDSNEISKYFTYTANGTAKIVSVVYTDTSNGNAVVTNTNTLAEGTHIIKCTVTKETGAVASATKTIVVEIDIVGTNPANPNQPDGIPDKYQVRVSYSCVNGSCSFSETYVTLYNEYGEFDEYGGGYLTDEQIPTFTPSPGYQNPTFNVKPTTSYEITKDTVFTATCTAIPIDLVP